MTNLIAKHGGYKNLKSFQMAEIASDLNFQFCEKFVPSFKMRDQMQGAARGGTQNISEGSQTSGTSKQSELRLVDVARASMEELLRDYKTYLRQRAMTEWGKEDVRALAVRKLAYAPNRSYKTYMTYMANDETAANCILCVIHQANFLLDQQLRALEKELVQHGDYKDRYKEQRKKQLLNQDADFDEFIKQFGLKRKENGQVVGLNDEVE